MALSFDYILLILFVEHPYMVCATTFKVKISESKGTSANRPWFIYKKSIVVNLESLLQVPNQNQSCWFLVHEVMITTQVPMQIVSSICLVWRALLDRYAYKLKHVCLASPFIEEATQKRQCKEHCMCIKQKQNISSHSFLCISLTLRKPFEFVWSLGAVYIVRVQHRGRGGFSLAHPSTQGGRGGLGPAHMCMWEKIIRP